jgi:excisionase family DNA binding protein
MQSDTTLDAPLLMTVRETAAALALCEKSVWQLTRDGKLPVVRIGRAVRYDLADVLRFIAASKTGGEP